MAGEPEPSATVVVLREAAEALEVLLLQRGPRRDGSPGPWVFPGGRIETEDGADDTGIDRRARVAAVRETHEEAGLAIRADELVAVSRWITPELAPRRFDTWFYAAEIAGDAPVRVDGVEIHDHRWLAPEEALASTQSGALELAPPTFVTVCWLARHARPGDALSAFAEAPPLTFRPCIRPVEGGVWMIYPGDAGYADGDPQRTGTRHRLWSDAEGYRYERSHGIGP